MTKRITLAQLADFDPETRFWLSFMMYCLDQVWTDIDNGLPFFDSEELNQIEDQYEEGLTLRQIDRILSSKGMIVKVPTFRRYVSLGLVSGTLEIKREAGRNVGYYPATVIREINLIKYCLFANLDLRGLQEAYADTHSPTLWDVFEQGRPNSLDPVSKITNNKIVRSSIEPLLKDLDDSKLAAKQRKQILSALNDFESACETLGDSFDTLKHRLKGVKISGRDALKILDELGEKEKQANRSGKHQNGDNLE